MPAIVTFITPALGPNIIEEISTGGDNEIDVLEIFSEWKDWILADAGARLGLPQAFTVIGGEPKSPTKEVGQSFFLHPEWKFRPANLDHRVVLVGDIQVLGGVGSIVVPTVGAFTALVEVETSTLITGLSTTATSAEVAILQTAVNQIAYLGSIWIDANNGTAGTTVGTNGTPGNPVIDLADGLTLAAATGIRSFVVLDGVLTFTGALTEWTVELRSESEVNFNGQSINGSTFKGGILKGAMTGSAVSFSDALLDSVSGFRGSAVRCGLSGTLALGAGESTLSWCHSRDPGLATPTLDFVGVGRTANLRGYSGGLKIENMTDVSNVATVDYVAGQAIVDSSCTAGTLVLRGILPPPIDTSTGTTVNIDGVVSGIDLQDVLLTLEGREEIDFATQELVSFGKDGVTPRRRWKIETDAGGTDLVTTDTGIQTKRKVSSI